MLPRTPYRGIESFRYSDRKIFFARKVETRELLQLVVVYRGVFLYGGSGSGKSSLINAGLLPAVEEEGFRADRIRVQPRFGDEFVVERIPLTEEDGSFLPSSFASDAGDSAQLVLGADELRSRLAELGAEARAHRPLLILDQFEELVTLFEEAPDGRELEQALACQQRIVDALIDLLQDTTLPVKLLFGFREDYLAKVRKLLDRSPELVSQSLSLTPPGSEALPQLIRGPFEDHPGQFDHELSPELATQLAEAVRRHTGAGSINLTELQIVCLRLWESSDPERLLEEKGTQGLLEEYLEESLNRFPEELHYPAVALLSQMVTASGVRNVVSGDDLIERVRTDEADIPEERLERTLEALEKETKLVRRERRGDLDLFEISSEFLVPWIGRQRAERLRARERAQAARRQRRLFSALGVAAALVALMAGVTIFALTQREEAQAQARRAHARQLDTAAVSLLGIDPGLSLLLASEAARKAPSQEAEDVLRQSFVFFRERSTFDAGSPVVVAEYSRDGSQILVAGRNGRARVYDSQSHALVRTLNHGAPILDAAFSSDGRLAVTGGEDGTVKLWAARRRPIRTLQHGDPIRAASFSRDGQLLVTAGGTTAKIWRADGRLLADLPWTKQVTGASFSPDGTRLIVMGNDRIARVYGTREGKLLDTLDQKGMVRSASFSPERNLIVTAGANEIARIWRIEDGDVRLEHELHGHRGEVLGATFSPRASQLATASANGTGKVWNVASGDQVASLGGHSGIVDSVAFSPDGNFVVTAARDRLARVFLADRGTARVGLAGHDDRIRTAEFSSSGGDVLTASDDGTARLWDARPQPVLTLLAGFGAPVAKALYVPPGNRILVAGPGRRATLVRASDGTTVRTFSYRSPVTAVDASPDGKRVAMAAGRRVFVYAPDGARRALVHPAPATSVAFAPNGSVVTGDARGVARIWTRTAGRGVRSKPVARPSRMSPAVPTATGSRSRRRTATCGSSRPPRARLTERSWVTTMRSTQLPTARTGSTSSRRARTMTRCSGTRSEARNRFRSSAGTTETSAMPRSVRTADGSSLLGRGRSGSGKDSLGRPPRCFPADSEAMRTRLRARCSIRPGGTSSPPPRTDPCAGLPARSVSGWTSCSHLPRQGFERQDASSRPKNARSTGSTEFSCEPDTS